MFLCHSYPDQNKPYIISCWFDLFYWPIMTIRRLRMLLRPDHPVRRRKRRRRPSKRRRNQNQHQQLRRRKRRRKRKTRRRRRNPLWLILRWTWTPPLGTRPRGTTARRRRKRRKRRMLTRTRSELVAIKNDRYRLGRWGRGLKDKNNTAFWKEKIYPPRLSPCRKKSLFALPHVIHIVLFFSVEKKCNAINVLPLR